MKFLVYYITDAERVPLTNLEAGQAMIKTAVEGMPQHVSADVVKEFKSKKDLRVVKLETEVKLRGRDMWEFDDGKCVKHFVAFDTETAPPTLIFNKLDLQQLRWLEAPLPMSWLNEHGSIVSSDGTVVVRGENEPPDYNDLYGTNKINAVGTTALPIGVWPNQVSGGSALYPTAGSSAPTWIQGVSGNYSQHANWGLPYSAGSTAANTGVATNNTGGLLGRLFGP